MRLRLSLPAVLIALAAALPAVAQPLQSTPLSTLTPSAELQGYAAAAMDSDVVGPPLRIAGREFETGIGAHAPSEITYELDGAYTRFRAWVGIDDSMIPHKLGSVEFIVTVDGREAYRSGLVSFGEAARRVDVDLTGARELRLAATDGGDNINGDHADWGDALLLGPAAAADAPGPVRATLSVAGLKVALDDDGDLVGLDGGRQPRISGKWRLAGFRPTGPARMRRSGGGVTFTRGWSAADGRACSIAVTWRPSGGALRWETAVTSQGKPWTAAAVTTLSCADAADTRVWAAWSDPERRPGRWRDPLEPIAFASRSWRYGNVTQAGPTGADFIVAPLVSLLSARADQGVTLLIPPDGVLLDLSLALTASGDVRLTRTRHRFGGGKTVRFAMELAPHEAHWRGALRTLTARYPAYFDAPNPRAHELAGTAAYSGSEQPVDADKLRAMAFRTNWKLSDDFPYMGQFLPPVRTPDEKWARAADEPCPPGKEAWTTARRMNDYARWMKAQGFHVLSYFNVTEYGRNLVDRPVEPARAADPALWKDGLAYLKLKLPTAALKPVIGTCYNAWIVDVGDPAYRDFMLEQARRNIALLPDTDGVCIDRLDWLRLYNPAGDDGVSWVDGKPARSLYRSWLAFTDRLGPLMHAADKVIFANTMTMRLELCRRLDGIYTEHGDQGGALNGAALMGLRKPVLAWTLPGTLRDPDPDSFFQRHLYMGAFPTAPYPYNNHCIAPDAWAERYYMDYGPLMDAMRGKRWVLTPGCVEVAGGQAKANLFETPEGWALPVALGGEATQAVVTLRGVPVGGAPRITALHPGRIAEEPVSAVWQSGALTLRVPLRRGCAMVKIVR